MKLVRLSARNPDLIDVSSDWHQSPYGLGSGIVRFLGMALRENATAIGNGDLFDFVIYGSDMYEGSETIDNFRRALGGNQFIYVCGNHDPDYLVKRVFGKDKNIIIVNSVDIDNWHFEHGDRLAVDWSWLRPFYLWFAKIALRINYKLWFKFCEWRGWKRPGKYHNPKPSGTEGECYTDLTGIVWGNALKESQCCKMNFCIGHTHTARMILSPELYGSVVDDGDLNDGSYAQILRGQPSISWICGDKT